MCRRVQTTHRTKCVGTVSAHVFLISCYFISLLSSLSLLCIPYIIKLHWIIYYYCRIFRICVLAFNMIRGNFRVYSSVVQIFISVGSTLLLLDPGLDAFATGYRDRPTAVHDQKAWFAHYWWTISVQSVVLQRAEIESCRG